MLNTIRCRIILSTRLQFKNVKIKMSRTVILSIVLCGCEALSLTMRRKQRLRVFEDRVLRKIYGPKGDEVTGKWRRMGDEEICVLYSIPNIIRVIKSRRMRWAGHVACMEHRIGAHRVSVGRLERKRPLGSARYRWENNIKIDLQEVEYEGMDSIDLAREDGGRF